MEIKKKIRVRFAPSPTGQIHIGNAKIACYNYLLKLKLKGSFILRVEDTDSKRNVKDAILEQYKDLKWMGININESFVEGGSCGPYIQSQRKHLYNHYIDKLIKEKKAYYCFCSKDDIKLEKENYIKDNDGSMDYKYSRRCLNNNNFYNDKSKDKVVRIIVDYDRVYSFFDLVRGEIKVLGKDIGDFVIIRSDGTPLLNLVVVLDDHLMKITHVLRGEDHITNTFKQLVLYEAFNWSKPEFLHLPMILNKDKTKISKRVKNTNEEVSIKKFRELGYLPQSIVNYLLLLGWNPRNKQEIFSFDEASKLFKINEMNSSQSSFSLSKLNSINSAWIEKINIKDYNYFCWKWLVKEFYFLENTNYNGLKRKCYKLFILFKNRINNFSEISSYIGKIFFNIEKLNLDDFNHVNNFLSNNGVLMNDFIYSLSNDKWTREKVGEALNSVDKIMKKDFIITLRLILTKNRHGPEIKSIIYLLGKKHFINEIKKYWKKI